MTKVSTFTIQVSANIKRSPLVKLPAGFYMSFAYYCIKSMNALYSAEKESLNKSMASLNVWQYISVLISTKDGERGARIRAMVFHLLASVTFLVERFILYHCSVKFTLASSVSLSIGVNSFMPSPRCRFLFAKQKCFIAKRRG